MSDPSAHRRVTARSHPAEALPASEMERPEPYPDVQTTSAPAPATIQAPARGLSQATLGCLIGAGIIALALLIAGALVAFAVRESTQRVAETVERANPANIIQTVIPLPTPTVVARPPAVLQVRAISELATAQSLLSTIVEVQQARVGNVLYEKLVLIACGRVKAGVALAQLRDSDVDVLDDGKTVRVKLPRAQLLDAYLIDDSTQPCTTRVYDRTNLLLIPESKDLEAQAREKALEAIRTTAIESGLLGDARRNAQIAIERILLNTGYERVEFIEE
ncbi:DUF4230 domain-containing protein [Candidatus Roseilinea sp. NK_OTU-006]|jgi:hypothetical protein|uniref:DUF4230 domain-containing protein n=1 Tax=Candidatus Roseilinea sp. NK_OTU-006 TaxID=2704250 RepID=UPI00145FB5E9|nr:DUF4230 domain-containing protein [Candidatus Roseilinea sp. NK_OTU-006]